MLRDHKKRFDLNHRNAEEFISEVRKRGNPFIPVGAAHGWDAATRKESFSILEGLGFEHISLGGMVRRPAEDVIEALELISVVKKENPRLHLLGITKLRYMSDFLLHGVTSIDSTTPLRQAFMDEKDNYWTKGERFTAIRVPQVDASPSFKRKIKSGSVDQGVALAFEQKCLDLLRSYDSESTDLDSVLNALHDYELLCGGKEQRIERYRRTLEAKPWKDCSCGICDQIGIEIVIFRGAERNRRRGFHNLSVFREELEDSIL